MNKMEKVITCAVVGGLGYALYTAAMIVVDHENLRKAHENSIEYSRESLTMARDFTKVASESNGVSEKACEVLKAALKEMVVNNLSYVDIGTTREKFEMIRDYNGCKFN